MMKLNIDILKESLSDVISLEQHGTNQTALALTRPFLYDGGSVFKGNNVYIASSDFLPKNPKLENGTVIICIDKEPPLAYYSEKNVLLLLKTKKNIYSIFNIVQKIFDKYDEWDAKLQQITMERGKLRSLLDISHSIFQKSIIMLDKDLEVITNTVTYNESFKSDKSFRTKDSFIKFSLNNRREKGVYIYNKFNYNIMCLNLFKENNFIGGIYLKGEFDRPFRASDEGLLIHLKKYVDILLPQYHEILSVDNNTMKKIFMKILDGDILNDSKLLREIRLNNNKQDRYVCIKFKLEDNSKVIPTKLVIEQIEEILPGTLAMVYQNVIVAFMNFRMSTSNPISEGSVFINFLQAMGYRAGLSEEFTDILKARYYFNAACAAIDIGYLLNPELEVYYFKDYVKEYVLSMITSEVPPEMICEKGLLRLLEHDKTHNTSYFNELRTYINCNMNAVQAAKKLYMHRNTLLIHLEHIIKLLGINLDDPKERMYVQLSYKLLESEGIHKSLY